MVERLDKNVVHEICTNQVVLTLQACVKELLENSMDAAAGRIEIKLRESGVELLEVVDDGHGVTAENWEQLCQRHATSKIREFDDLSRSLCTFGFRGEALAAICAMGDVTVCTRCAGETAATLLTYDRYGKLASKAPAAREVGTTLSVRELFKRIPVRHRDFVKNSKAQVTATVRLLQSYAIANPEIRFHIVAEKARGHGCGRASLLSTSGQSRGWRQAAAAVLGDSVVADVEPLELHSAVTGWSISGVISMPHGGRRARDSQLFFVNKRPIDPPKRIAKLINDTYHQYNSRMWPCVILSFSAAQQLVDVNVTPDKRTVFLHNEEKLLAELQEKLTAMFAPANGSTPGSALTDFGIGPSISMAKTKATPQEESALVTEFAPGVPMQLGVSPPRQTAGDAVASAAGPGELETPEKLHSRETSQTVRSSKPLTSVPFSSALRHDVPSSREAEGSIRIIELDAMPQDQSPDVVMASEPAEPRDGLSIAEYVLEALPPESSSLSISEYVPDAGPPQSSSLSISEYVPDTMPVDTEPGVLASEQGQDVDVLEWTPDVPATVLELPTQPDSSWAALPSEPLPMRTLGTVSATVTMAELQAALLRKRRRLSATPPAESIFSSSPSVPGSSSSSPSAASAASKVHFPSAFSLSSLRDGAQQPGGPSLEEVAKFATTDVTGGADAGDNGESAQIRFDKQCFTQMRVAGQFNLGFIITVLRTKGTQGPDGLQLFIVDQHASDEKHRFENLNKESKIDRQPLVNPHPLQLTPAQEQVAEANLEVFRVNGFDVQRDETQPPGRRLRLLALPACRGLVFKESDLHDLLFSLEEAEAAQSHVETTDSSAKAADNTEKKGLLNLNGHRGAYGGVWSSTAVLRPRKVWQLLACKACRGAIMIGKGLRTSEMERVLMNLSQLEQPFNCPHGRPTMRHLIDAGAASRLPPRTAPMTALLEDDMGASQMAY